MEEEYKYKQKYNPKSNRLQDYDYGANGCYFITICTKDRQNYFGEIIDGNMILNNFGKIVLSEIRNIEIFRENVLLDEFCIMPNHIHLVLVIDNKNVETSIYRVSNETQDPIKKDTINGCLYEKGGSLMKDKNIMLNKNTVGFVIRRLKGKITYLINKSSRDNDLSRLSNLSYFQYFAWQPNYYDRIIRNEYELNKIRIYIQNNPLKWEIDKNNSENIFM